MLARHPHRPVGDPRGVSAFVASAIIPRVSRQSIRANQLTETTTCTTTMLLRAVLRQPVA